MTSAKVLSDFSHSHLRITKFERSLSFNWYAQYQFDADKKEQHDDRVKKTFGMMFRPFY